MAAEKQSAINQLAFNVDELTLLSNALNETINGPLAISQQEFHTRTGATRNAAEALLLRIQHYLKQQQHTP